jgi:hypothetical protein
MDTKIITVTSVNETLWRDYAGKSIGTWTSQPRIYWEHLDVDAKWDQWRASNAHRQEPDFGHTWRRFSYKVQHQLAAWREYQTTHDYLIWMDADVVELSKPTKEFVQDCLPIRREGTQTLDDSDTLSYLGRGLDYHPETGWICYDLNNPRLPQLMLRLEEVYLANEIFTYKEWHDAYVWEEVCRAQQLCRRNLCEQPYKRGEAFGRSPLKKHYEHLKGPRKLELKTTPTGQDTSFP